MMQGKTQLTSYPVADEENLERFKAFLKDNNLPFDDIRLEGNQFFFYQAGNKIVGCGGLEYYGDHGLLRSVAVAKELRGEGLGKEIVEDLLSRARDRSLVSVSLLTETAESFFDSMGFKKQSREEAPIEIKSSTEFSSVCPVSAVLMRISTGKNSH